MSTNQQQFAESINWDDDVVPTGGATQASRKLERFKAKGGKTHRVLILDDSPVQVFQHYKKDFGYIRCLRSLNNGLKCAACDAGDKAAQRFAVNVLVYPDTANVPADVTSSNTHVMGWLFGAKAFSDLRNIKSEWGDLTNYDLKVNCTNEQFQHLAITPCREKLYSASPSAIGIGEMIATEKYDLKSKLGRTSTESEVAGIWSGSLTRDDIFLKKEDGAAKKPSGSGAPTPYRPDDEDAPKAAQPKIDIDSLLSSRKS